MLYEAPHLPPKPALAAPAPSRALQRRKRDDRMRVAARASGAQPFKVTRSQSQPGSASGAVGVRVLSNAERSGPAFQPGYVRARNDRAKTRAGHQFQIVQRPDGRILHIYGDDVPANLRRVVLPAAQRKVRRQATFTPQTPGA